MKRKRTWRLFVAVGVALAIPILACGNASQLTASRTSESHGVETTTPLATDPVSSAPAEPSLLHVGETATDGHWNVTILAVRTSQGANMSGSLIGDHPTPGNQYVIFKILVQNLQPQQDQFSSFGFVLRDLDGNSYTQAAVISEVAQYPPQGTVLPQGKLKGEITYEIPKSVHALQLLFQTYNVDGSQTQGAWQLSV